MGETFHTVHIHHRERKRAPSSSPTRREGIGRGNKAPTVWLLRRRAYCKKIKIKNHLLGQKLTCSHWSLFSCPRGGLWVFYRRIYSRRRCLCAVLTCFFPWIHSSDLCQVLLVSGYSLIPICLFFWLLYFTSWMCCCSLSLFQIFSSNLVQGSKAFCLIHIISKLLLNAFHFSLPLF